MASIILWKLFLDLLGMFEANFHEQELQFLRTVGANLMAQILAATHRQYLLALVEEKRRIPHDTYATELQKVRMLLADRNVYGVDLNPVTTELAEVSLRLNAIYGEEAEPGKPPKAARVSWFGYQLFAGNNLAGARREVYKDG